MSWLYSFSPDHFTSCPDQANLGVHLWQALCRNSLLPLTVLEKSLVHSD